MCEDFVNTEKTSSNSETANATTTGIQENKKKIRPVLKECPESASSPDEFEEVGRAGSWRALRSQ